MEPTDTEVQELLKRFRVATNAGKQVSDDYLREIAQSSCKEWKHLPSLLGLDSIVADDIDKRSISEWEKRHEFLKEWKRREGSKATYKQLIRALLKIKSRDDAEKVCTLLKKSAPTATPAASNSIPATKAKNSTPAGKNLRASVKTSTSSSTSAASPLLPTSVLCTGSANIQVPHAKCKHCEKTGTRAAIAEHDKKCTKKVISCTNTDCDATIKRQNLKRHLETCKHGEVPCKYQRIGCDTILKRKDMSAHEDEKQKDHLHMAVEKIIDLDRKFISIEEESLSMEEKIATINQKIVLRSGRPFTFKVADTAEMFTVASIYVDGYHMAVSVRPETSEDGRKRVSVSVKLLKGENDESLSWPFLGKVSIAILNQLHDDEHIKQAVNINDGQPEQIYRLCNLSALALAYNPIRNTQYLKDDTLYFRVAVNVNVIYDKPWLKCTAAAEKE